MFSPIFCLIFFIGAISIQENEFKLVLCFTLLFKGDELRAYKIKPVLFLGRFDSGDQNITQNKGEI